MKSSIPILGTTIYSFTNEWQQRMYSLEDMIAKVADLGIGPAVEVVGFQSFREFPDITFEFAKNFRDLMDKYELVSSCLSANVDAGRRLDRLMTSDELVDYIRRQIISAEKLGFPVMRIQALVGQRDLELLAPIAERYKVHVACELHAPLTFDNPVVVALKNSYDRIGSEYLGFVPDFSCTMTAVPEGYWQNLRNHGASDGLIDRAKEIWKTNNPTPEKFAALAAAREEFNAPEDMLGQLNLAMTMFGHMAVEDWHTIMPYVRHIHGKFYEVTPDGVEPSIPYPELMSFLLKEGYSGTISAEWEGQAFSEDAIGFDQVKAWHDMCSKLLHE